MGSSFLSRKFSYSDNRITFVFVGVSVAVFFVCRFMSSSAAAYLALSPACVKSLHWYWQFFTYMFVHLDPWHLLSNMLGLCIFGRIVEKSVGSKEFSLFYLLCGTLSGIAAFALYAFQGKWGTFVLGASGALYSVMLLFAVLFPTATVYIFGIIPIRAPLLMVLYFLLDFFGQFRADGIAHCVHLFGFLFAYLYILVRMRINPLRRWGIIR